MELSSFVIQYSETTNTCALFGGVGCIEMSVNGGSIVQNQSS